MERILTRLLGEVRARHSAFAEAPEEPSRVARAEQLLGCRLPEDFADFLRDVGTVPWPVLIKHPEDFPRTRPWPNGFMPFASDGEHYFGYLVERELATQRSQDEGDALTTKLLAPGGPSSVIVQLASVSVAENELSMLAHRTFASWLKSLLDRETTRERGTSETIEIPIPVGSQPAVGARFDRYRIEDELGSGGMGRVFRALDTKLRRRVALKVLRVGEYNQAEGIAALLREARLAAALDHPNVVRIFDVGEAAGTAFVSMELVNGTSLRRFVGDESLSPGRKLRWLVLVASALAAAHRRGLIHRDIKPENVMIGEDSDVKVLDFGIARLAAGSAQAPFEPTTFAEIGAPTDGTAGTPKYMAPEQIRGEPLDGRCDEFAWGVMAYELMVGHSPWGEGDGMPTIARVLTIEAPPIATVRPEIPQAVAAVIERALKKSADERFPNMEELIAALGEPPDASGPVARISLSSGPHVAVRDRLLPTSATRAIQVPSSRSLRALLSLAFVFGLFSALALGELVAYQFFVKEKPVAKPTPAPAQPARAIAVTELVIPEKPAPDALRLYDEALRDFRAGAPSDTPKMKQAIAADPTFAAARFQLAAIMVWAGGEPRDAYLAAQKLKDKLGPRDADVLDAIRPCAVPEIADYKTCRANLSQTAARYATDAQVALLYGAVCLYDGDVNAALEEMKRAVSLDPEFGMAIGAQVEQLAYVGDTDGALALAETCVGTSNGVCWLWGAWTSEQLGRPDLFERYAKQLWLASGTASAGFPGFANTLAAKGAQRDAVEDALTSYLASIPEKNRAWRRERDQAALDALEGNFGSAVHRLELILDAAITSEDLWRWLRVPALWLDILRESGDSAAAGRAARKLRGRLPGLPRVSLLDDNGLASEPLPILIDTELASSTLSQVEHDRLRAEWVASMKPITRPMYLPYIWLYGYAGRVESKTAAAKAIAAAGDFGGVPAFRPRTASNAALGHLYQLAGDKNSAHRYLGLAAKSSVPMEYPMAFVRSQLHYGIVLAERGEKAQACAAFAKVTRRWGHAKPRSVSAEEAKKRAAALGCGL